MAAPLLLGGQFEYRWTEHPANLLGVLGHLFYSGTMVDVTLACKDGTLKCHQMVLASCSPYFQSLFMGNPCQHPIVFMHNLSLAEVKVIVDFMYNGTITCPVDLLTGILETSKNLQVRGLEALFAGKNTQPMGSVSGLLQPLGVMHPHQRQMLDQQIQSPKPAHKPLSHRRRGRPRKDECIPMPLPGLMTAPVPAFNTASMLAPVVVPPSQTMNEDVKNSSTSQAGTPKNPDDVSSEESDTKQEQRENSVACSVDSDTSEPAAVPGPKKRGRKPKPPAPVGEITFVCLEEDGKSAKYNALYNEKAKELALRSGWILIQDKVRRTLKGNSKDRSKGILEKSRMVYTFRLPDDLVLVSQSGRFDYQDPITQDVGTIDESGFNTAVTVLTLKGLVRQTQFALKESQLQGIKFLPLSHPLEGWSPYPAPPLTFLDYMDLMRAHNLLLDDENMDPEGVTFSDSLSDVVKTHMPEAQVEETKEYGADSTGTAQTHDTLEDEQEKRNKRKKLQPTKIPGSSAVGKQKGRRKKTQPAKLETGGTEDESLDSETSNMEEVPSKESVTETTKNLPDSSSAGVEL